jgi:hypothetical protein
MYWALFTFLLVNILSARINASPQPLQSASSPVYPHTRHRDVESHRGELNKINSQRTKNGDYYITAANSLTPTTVVLRGPVVFPGDSNINPRPLERNIRLTGVLRTVALASVGAVILAFSEAYPKTLMLVQGIKAIGWPLLEDNFKDLKSTFEQLTIVLRTTVPQVRENGRTIKRLKKDLVALEHRFSSEKSVNEGAYRRESARIQNEIKLKQQSTKQLGSAISHIHKALDPEHLGDTLMRLYASILACIGVAASSLAQYFAIGFNVGLMLSSKLLEMIGPHKTTVHGITVDHLRKWHLLAPIDEVGGSAGSVSRVNNRGDDDGGDWIDLVVKTLCVAVGISLTFYSHKLAEEYGAAALGAELVLMALREVVFDVANLLKIPDSAVASANSVFAIVQWKLIEMGVQHAEGGRGTHPEGQLKVLLRPLQFLEEMIVKKVMFDEQIFK